MIKRKLFVVIMTATMMSAIASIPVYAGNGKIFKSILSAVIPDEGITIDGRTYTEDEINQVIDEIESDSYEYSHKDHHCILSSMSEEEIEKIVSLLKILGKF